MASEHQAPRWSLGCVSAIDVQGRTIWIVEAHGGDGKRFVAHADERLTEFMELESAIRERQLQRAFQRNRPEKSSEAQSNALFRLTNW